jgi:uncharacterized membrane protein YdjX (TVP38/TMEM64 family)
MTETRMANESQFRAVLKALVMVAVLAGIALIVRYTDFRELLSPEWIDARVKGHGPFGILVFLGVSALFTAVGLPRQAVGFFGGYAYGFLAGTGLALAATTMGCAATFLYSRFFGRRFVSRRYGGKIARVDRFLGENTFTTTVMIRFMPLGSNVLTSLLAGVSSVRALPFIGGSMLGFLPQTAIFALLGSGFKVDPAWRITLAVFLLLVSTGIGVTLYKRNKEAASLRDG